MRRILTERARGRKKFKRGGRQKWIELDPDRLAAEELPEELIALDEALIKLAGEGPIKAVPVR